MNHNESGSRLPEKICVTAPKDKKRYRFRIKEELFYFFFVSEKEMSDAEVVNGENRLLDFLFFVRNGKIASQFPVMVFFSSFSFNFL